MPILDPSAIPSVNLPSTGIDPTAGAAAPAAATLSAHDAALIAASATAFADPNLTAAQAGAVAGAAADAAAAAAGAGPTGNVVEPPVELTTSQKIAAKITAKKAQIVKLTAEVATLEGQYRSADLLDSVKAGSVIVARVGRADTAKEVTASVVGVQTLETGDKRFKIFYGEGVDAELVVIQSNQIVDVKTV